MAGEQSPAFSLVLSEVSVQALAGGGRVIIQTRIKGYQEKIKYYWDKLNRYFEAWDVDNLISIRKWLAADGYPTDGLDQKINLYREIYHRAGAQHGESDRGMVKWFYERAAEQALRPRQHS